MTQAIPSRSDLADTPWQNCPGLRASAIDGAASMIVMEVLIDALARLPGGRAALDEACARRAAVLPDETLGGMPTEAAASALAVALIAVASEFDDDHRAAA